MSYANITIEINGVELGATVEYEYTPEVPAKLYGHPDDQHEGEPEEFELNKLTVNVSPDEFSDASFFLENDEVCESIIESIKESWND